jgi:hypothetical protein
MPAPSDEGYRISNSGAVKSRIKALLARVDRLDSERRKKVRDAFRAIFARLSHEPLTWGEPERTLPHFKLTIYHVVHSVLSVYYTVIEEQRVVLIQSVETVQSFPLDNGPDENA